MPKTKHPTVDKRAQKFSRLQAIAGKSANEIAADIQRVSDGFTFTPAWRELRAKVLSTYGNECMCCGKAYRVMNVDHIKPRKFFPELALDFNNLQVLCSRCNKLKGNKHSTDYRRHPA